MDRLKEVAMALFIVTVIFIVVTITCLPAGAQTTMPMTQVGNLWTVQVRMNGAIVNLLVDTGASISVVKPSKIGLSPLEVSQLPSVPVKGFVTGKALPVATVHVRLAKDVKDFSVGVADIPGLVSDGVLGNDILSQFSQVQINYGEKTLLLE